MRANYKYFKLSATETEERRAPEGWFNRPAWVWFNRVTVTNCKTGKRTRFDYYRGQGNPREMDKNAVISAFFCFIQDALIGGDSFENFVDDFGYNDAKTAWKVWNGCKRANEKAHRISADPTELYNEMADIYG